MKRIPVLVGTFVLALIAAAPANAAGAGLFLSNSPTPEQGRAGALTIVKTEAAYLASGSLS